MVCGRKDGEWGGEVLEIGDGEEGEEWGSIELGSAESVRSRRKGQALVYTGWTVSLRKRRSFAMVFFGLARFGSRKLRCVHKDCQSFFAGVKPAKLHFYCEVRL